MHAIAERGIHIIGAEGAHASWPGLEAWGRKLPGGGQSAKPIEVPERAQAEPAAPAARPAAPEPSPPPQMQSPTEPASLLIDHAVRSGQSITFEQGDITILGSVASGAEVVAGGSIHVYGALRGRAIAGLSGRTGARIYCRKLHAELVAIDGVYQTAEDMPPERIGAPSCAWLDGDLMRITPID
jgi:septum site-determining protein MinC